MFDHTVKPPAAVQAEVKELIAAGKALHDGLQNDERAALRKALELGHLLNQLKGACAHGEFGAALGKMGVKSQRASEYMRLAKSPAGGISECRSIRDALEGLARPPFDWRGFWKDFA